MQFLLTVPIFVEAAIFVVITFAVTSTRPQTCTTVSARAVTWRQALDTPSCSNRHSPKIAEATAAADDKANGSSDWNSARSLLRSDSNIISHSNIVSDSNSNETSAGHREGGGSSSGTRCDGRCQYRSPVLDRWLRQSAAGVLRPGSDHEAEVHRLLASSVLVANASVWTAGRILQTLTWEAAGQEYQFFQFKGCYGAPHQIQNSSESYGPFSCFHHCNQRGPFKLMALKGFSCLCLNEIDLIAWTSAFNASCRSPCPETPYHCGGRDSFHSVYVVPEYVALQKTAAFSTGCFVGKFEFVNQQHLIVINESLCDQHQANSFCVSRNGTSWRMETIEEVDGETFRNLSSNCSGGLVTSLPGDYHLFMLNLYYAMYYEHRSLLNQPFWLDLRLKTFVWSPKKRNDNTDSQVLHNSPATTSGCLALGKRWNGDLYLQVLPCETAHPYLTCCQDDNITTIGLAPEMSAPSGTLADPDRKRKEAEAMAVGVSSLAVLLVFLSTALTILILKKMGKLRVRQPQKAAFNSTDDWDSPENSFRRNSLAARLQASYRTRTSLVTEELYERFKSQDSAKDSQIDAKDKMDSRDVVSWVGKPTEAQEKLKTRPSVRDEQEDQLTGLVGETTGPAVAVKGDEKRSGEEEDSLARRRKDRTQIRGHARSEPAAPPCLPPPAEARPSSIIEDVYSQPWDTRSLPLQFFDQGVALFAVSHFADSPDPALVNVPVTTGASLDVNYDSRLDITAGKTVLATKAIQAKPCLLPRQSRSQDPVRDARENIGSQPAPLEISGQGTNSLLAEESRGTTSRASFKPHPAPRRPSLQVHIGHPPRTPETVSSKDTSAISQPAKAVANSVRVENEVNSGSPNLLKKGNMPVQLKLGSSKSENLSATDDGGKALGNTKQHFVDFSSLPHLGFCLDDYDQPVDSLDPLLSPVYAEPECLSGDSASREFEARFKGFSLPRREESTFIANNAPSKEAPITEARTQPADRSSDRRVSEKPSSQLSTEPSQASLDREMECATKAVSDRSGTDNKEHGAHTVKAENAGETEFETQDFIEGANDKDYAAIEEVSDIEKAQERSSHAKVQTCISLPYAIPRKDFEKDRASMGLGSKSTDDLRNPRRKALNEDMEDYAEIDESATLSTRSSSARTSTTLPGNMKPRPSPNGPEEEVEEIPDQAFVRGYTLPHGRFPSEQSKFKLPKRAKTEKARPSKGKKPDDGATIKSDVPWKAPKDESKMGPADVKSKSWKTERKSDSKVPHELGPDGDVYAKPVVRNKEK